MTINLETPESKDLKPKIMVFGVGGAGGNAVNNMVEKGLDGCEFVVANTDAQVLASSKAQSTIQMGIMATEGLGAGSQPEIGRAAAEEVLEDIRDHLNEAHMVFITAGMGGGTGTGAAPVIASAARELGILTVGVVTKPFNFEGQRRMRTAEEGITELQTTVDTLIIIPNQNLFRIANGQTTFADAFAMADQVLHAGVASVTDLMVKEGLINLDFADVRSVMKDMGNAMMGTGHSQGENRSKQAAEDAIANPLLDEASMKGARGLLISISGGNDLTLFEVDEAATRIRQEVDPDANVILGATFDDKLDGVIKVSVVATGIDKAHPDAERSDESGVVNIAKRIFGENSESEGTEQAPAVEEEQVASQSRSAETKSVPTSIDPGVTISNYSNRGANVKPNTTGGPGLTRRSRVDGDSSNRDPYIPPVAEVPNQSQNNGQPGDSNSRLNQTGGHYSNAPQASGQLSQDQTNDEKSRKSSTGFLRRLTGGRGKREEHANPNNMGGQYDESMNPANNSQPTAQSDQNVNMGSNNNPTNQPEVSSDSVLHPKSPPLNVNPAQSGQSSQESEEEEQLEIPAFLRRQSK